MTVLKPLAALLLVAGLAACSTDVDEDASAGVGPGSGYGAGQLDPSSVEYFNQSIGDRVFFATDSSLLDAAAQATLRAQADWLRQNSARTATIEGHADERGTREYNLALGARRAAAARSFLIGEGIDASRLRMVTYGKERPDALCSNESCWSQNRRSVTVVAGGPIS
tara:strand:- start:330 stop:830 length:501 start_codon:yes stop_codon:yes gene_type:complete